MWPGRVRSSGPILASTSVRTVTARAYAAPRVHGDGERGPHRRRVVLDHHRDLQLVEALGGQRHADQAAAVPGHEVDGLGRDPVGRHHEVALVLAVLVIDHQQDPAGADLLDGLLDGRKRRHVIPLRASDRTRYLPITSASMFTACPTRRAPSVVTASVCGISITSKLPAPSAATVRLTPSTATEPCGIRSGSRYCPASAIRQKGRAHL